MTADLIRLFLVSAGKNMGTAVKNPVRRNGIGYVECCHCHKMYTKLGISRHWSKCTAKKKG